MLTLPIKKKWFGMILSGEKKEEYREIKPYWTRRFSNIFTFFDTSEREVMFRNGYSENSQSFIAKVTLSIGTGREEWGAEPDKEYYILKILEVVMWTRGNT